MLMLLLLLLLLLMLMLLMLLMLSLILRVAVGSVKRAALRTTVRPFIDFQTMSRLLSLVLFWVVHQI